MAEDYPEIKEGPLDHGAEIFEAVANGAIAQWSPVVIVAPGTGETLPRVGTTTVLRDDAIAGVKVYPNKTVAAGDIVQVVRKGRCKCAVSAAAARGDGLSTSATAGQAAPQLPLDAPAAYAEATVQTELDKIVSMFAEALTGTGVAAADIIAVDVNVPRGEHV